LDRLSQFLQCKDRDYARIYLFCSSRAQLGLVRQPHKKRLYFAEVVSATVGVALDVQGIDYIRRIRRAQSLALGASGEVHEEPSIGGRAVHSPVTALNQAAS
jgi:hypothetical protein